MFILHFTSGPDPVHPGLSRIKLWLFWNKLVKLLETLVDDIGVTRHMLSSNRQISFLA